MQEYDYLSLLKINKEKLFKSYTILEKYGL